MSSGASIALADVADAKFTPLKEQKNQGSPLAFHKVLVEQTPKPQAQSGLSKLLSKSRSTENLQQQELTASVSEPNSGNLQSPASRRPSQGQSAPPTRLPTPVARPESSSGELPFTCKVWLPNHRKLIVHVNEYTNLERLVRSVLELCCTVAEPRELLDLAKQLVINVADDEGKIDEDVPVLDPGQPVHAYGVHSFVLVVRGTSSPATVLLQSMEPREATLYIGPKNKRHLADPAARLFLAAEAGQLDTVRRLVENGFVDVNTTGIENWTALHFSCRKGHLPLVTYLLKQNAAVNAASKSGWTPLHLACHQGHIDTAEILLMWGADPQIKALDGKTARDVALEQGHQELAELLQEAEEEAANEREEKLQQAESELIGPEDDGEDGSKSGDTSTNTSPVSQVRSQRRGRGEENGVYSPEAEVLSRLEISGLRLTDSPSSPLES